MFKVTKGLALDIFSIVFNTRKKLNYNLCHASHFEVPQASSVYKGTEGISFLGPKICNILPTEIGDENSENIQRCYKNGNRKNAHVNFAEAS